MTSEIKVTPEILEIARKLLQEKLNVDHEDDDSSTAEILTALALTVTAVTGLVTAFQK